MCIMTTPNVHLAVKTPSGLTDRQVINNSFLQGDTFGSIMASIQVDSIGKECVKEGHTYLYKNELPVGFLGLVDDIIGVTEAGINAQKMNAFINIKTAEKTLQFGASKCKSMLVGKSAQNTINSDLLVDKWTVKYEENVLFYSILFITSNKSIMIISKDVYHNQCHLSSLFNLSRYIE